jgi:uncharacterized protein
MTEALGDVSPAEAGIRARIRHELEEELGSDLDSAILFGSRARGDAREDSDWDVAVVIRSDADVMKARVAARRLAGQLALELGQIVSFVVTPWDAANENGGILRNIATEGRRL